MRKGNAKILPPDPDALFLPYQEKWIRDTSRLKLMEKARQIGLSWSTAYPSSPQVTFTPTAFCSPIWKLRFCGPSDWRKRCCGCPAC